MTTDAARPGISEPPLEQPAVPVWFRSKTASASPASRPAIRRKKPLIDARPDQEQPLTFRQRVRCWLQGAEGRSFGVSLLFHAALLAIMAIVIYETLPGSGDRSTLLVDALESDKIALSEIDTRIDLPTAQEDLVPPQFQAVPIPEVDTELEVRAHLEDMLPAPGTVGDGSGGGAGLMLPRGENAVSRGSFTAWTIPDKPKMWEPYSLVIEVKLPEKVKRYRISDLDGLIEATDGFKSTIPFGFDRTFGIPIWPRVVKDGRPVRVHERNEPLPIVKGVVQLVIEIPGAEVEEVHERILIGSRILKERQVLDFVFETVKPDLKKPRDLFSP